MSKEKESESYKAMLEEVESIVTNISSQQLDLDEMITKVEKGYGIIKKMRGRLDETKEKVEKLRIEYEA